MYVQCMDRVWGVVLPLLHVANRATSHSLSSNRQADLSPVCTKHLRRMCQLCPTKEGERGQRRELAKAVATLLMTNRCWRAVAWKLSVALEGIYPQQQ